MSLQCVLIGPHHLIIHVRHVLMSVHCRGVMREPGSHLDHLCGCFAGPCHCCCRCLTSLCLTLPFVPPSLASCSLISLVCGVVHPCACPHASACMSRCVSTRSWRPGTRWVHMCMVHLHPHTGTHMHACRCSVAFMHGSMNWCRDMGAGSSVEVLYHVHACASED